MKLLICLEDMNYNKKTIDKGFKLAEILGYTVDVLFFHTNNRRKSFFFTLVNLIESKRISRRLGAVRYSVMRTKSEKTTMRGVIKYATKHDVKLIVMSAMSPDKMSIRNILFNKYNYFLRKTTKIDLHVVRHEVFNPFVNGNYESGVKAYLKRVDGTRAQFILTYYPSGKRPISGLFFKDKESKIDSGVFTYYSNNRVVYVNIYNGKINYLKSASS